MNRVIFGDPFCDVPLALYVIRGEYVVFIGELLWFVPNHILRLANINYYVK